MCEKMGKQGEEGVRMEERRKKRREDGRGWGRKGGRCEDVGNKQEGKRKERKVISTVLVGAWMVQP